MDVHVCAFGASWVVVDGRSTTTAQTIDRRSACGRLNGLAEAPSPHAHDRSSPMFRFQTGPTFDVTGRSTTQAFNPKCVVTTNPRRPPHTTEDSLVPHAIASQASHIESRARQPRCHAARCPINNARCCRAVGAARPVVGVEPGRIQAVGDRHGRCRRHPRAAAAVGPPAGGAGVAALGVRPRSRRPGRQQQQQHDEQ